MIDFFKAPVMIKMAVLNTQVIGKMDFMKEGEYIISQRKTRKTGMRGIFTKKSQKTFVKNLSIFAVMKTFIQHGAFTNEKQLSKAF